MADLQETLGAVLRRERRERGLTMKTLSERAALSEVYLSEVERGKKYPSALVLERLAEALGLAVPDLLELVADELRGPAPLTRAIGFALPSKSGSPRVAVKRIVQAMATEDVETMADLGAFLLSRRGTGLAE